MTASNQDEIPVLTDVLRAGRVPVAAVAAPSSGPPTASENWDHLERTVREAVLKSLLARVDLVFEQRIKDSLNEALEKALADIATELKQNVQTSVRDVVARAVAQEVSRLQAQRIKV